MSRKPIRPARNASTATSLAALNAQGYVPPRSPASRASAEHAERLGIGLEELERPGRRQVERGHIGRGALGVGERVRDRHAHVGVAEVRDRRAVAEPNEAVHDRCRVHDDLDALVRHVEEEVRLDHLEPLVRERGRVDRDLRPHRSTSGCASACSGVTSASSSRVRPRNGPPLAVRTRLSGSPSCAHWKSAECSLSTGISSAAAALARSEGELAGRDEALLVRERERDAVLERPHRPGRPGEAERGVQDDVRGSRARAAPSGRRRPASAARARRSASSRRSPPRARGRSFGRDHLERLAPDRAGRAEQGDPRHPGQCARPAPGARVVPYRPSVEGEDGEVRRRGGEEQGVDAGRACRRGRRAACPCPSRPCRA